MAVGTTTAQGTPTTTATESRDRGSWGAVNTQNYTQGTWWTTPAGSTTPNALLTVFR